MRYLVLAGASMSAVAAGMLCAAPARAQDTSETTSSGERYEYEDTYEYGAGSTIFIVNFRAMVGTDEIDAGSISRYFQYFTPEEIAQVSPPAYEYYIGSAIVSITGWSTPQFADSQYDIIDVFSEETYYSDVFSIITSQTTSGDGPDAVVPFGWRGNCNFDGASGATNFGLFDGQFAACEYAEGDFAVPPGTINTNTHTTTVYRNGTHYFQSVDDAYTDTYLFVPTATATTSSGERYESEQITEYGEGSTTYSASITAEIGGEEVALADMSRYSLSYGQTEVEQALPGSFVHMYQDVPVTVDAWQAPQLVDSSYDVIDVFTEDSVSSETFDVVTVQTTSGDEPNAVVPIGWRGSCGGDGASGATNFASSDGAFAECDYADSYLAVAPGSTNTNTHTTTVSRDVFRHFEIVDDAYSDFYVVRPAASSTSSRGTLERVLSSSTTVRIDTYATQIVGVAGGETLINQTVDGAFGDASVQSALETLSHPLGRGIDGAPTVVVWSSPVLTSSNEELSSSTTETETATQSYEVLTVTQAVGGSVSIGNRGACTSAGTSGVATGPSPTGSFAECQGGVSYSLSPGETNTNTHTTFVTETTVDTLVTENWLTTESYLLTGTPVLVGQIHSAVRDALFDGGSGFARRHGDALAARNGLGFALWADVFTGKTKTHADSAGPGNSYSAPGIAGGLSVRLSTIASLGIAASHEAGNSDLAGLSESADLSHTQLGLAAEFSPGVWRLAMTVGRGWGEIDTERGGASIGGVARASYDARTWFASAEGGPEFGLGPVTLRPLAGIEWSRAALGEFAESGGIALAGGKDSASRLAATVGAQAAARWSLPGGPGIRIWADARAGRVVDGEERDRAVIFAGAPGSALQVTSASEGDSYAAGRAGVSLFVAGGLGLHLGAEGRTGGGTSDWRANAGVSAAF